MVSVGMGKAGASDIVLPEINLLAGINFSIA
jgi:hypothetical protein